MEQSMDDYLKIYEKFKDVKEVADYLDDINTLRYYYRTQQFTMMQEHIHKLTIKYSAEVFVWNTINPIMPHTFEQSYINVENFLQVQGAVIIAKNVTDFCNRLSHEEAAIVSTLNQLSR